MRASATVFSFWCSWPIMVIGEMRTARIVMGNIKRALLIALPQLLSADLPLVPANRPSEIRTRRRKCFQVVSRRFTAQQFRHDQRRHGRKQDPVAEVSG